GCGAGKDLLPAGGSLATRLDDRPRPPPMEFRPDRRQDIAARRGVAEPHRRMTRSERRRLPLAFDLQLLGKSLIRVLPAVRRDRRTPSCTQECDGLQARMAPQSLCA